MTITYNIRNVTSSSVCYVMLRKFFQMVFVGDDRKSLHIYTATVLGASKGQPDKGSPGEKPMEVQETSFVSELGDCSQFRMRFEFAVDNNDNNEVESISHENLTDGEHGFLDEISCIRKVWGKNCRIIKDDEADIVETLKMILEDEHVQSSPETAALSRHSLLLTEQTKPGIEKKLLTSISVSGAFEEIPSFSEPEIPSEIALRGAYAVSVPHELKLPNGIELVNWIRTTIQFKYPLDTTDLNYIIKKDPESNGVIWAPDFTWYFSPAIKSFIDSRNCMVEIKRGIRGGAETCTCPLQSQKRVFYSSDKYQNSINTVPNRLTVNFHHWDVTEQINSRQKYRLATKDVLPTPSTFAEVSEINLFLDMSDEHSRGNRQFIVGVFISFALAFGIDSGRLTAVETWFTPLNYFLPADVWWIIFLTLFSLTLMNRPAKLTKHARGKVRFRKILMILSLVWICIIFGVSRSPLLSHVWTVIPETVHTAVNWFMGIALAGLLVCFIIYLHMSKVNKNDRLLIDLFGEDIL